MRVPINYKFGFRFCLLIILSVSTFCVCLFSAIRIAFKQSIIYRSSLWIKFLFIPSMRLQVLRSRATEQQCASSKFVFLAGTRALAGTNPVWFLITLPSSSHFRFYLLLFQEDPEDRVKQILSREFNLSETAFPQPLKGNDFQTGKFSRLHKSKIIRRTCFFITEIDSVWCAHKITQRRSASTCITWLFKPWNPAVLWPQRRTTIITWYAPWIARILFPTVCAHNGSSTKQ